MTQSVGKMKGDLTYDSHPVLDEGYVIDHFIAPVGSTQPIELNCNEDAAVLEFPVGKNLIVTTDAIIEGKHFLPTESPESIAKKALRINLSDLAAMGAQPFGYTLCLSYNTDSSTEWISRFFSSLGQENINYQISLLGGDTNRINGPTNISITAFGLVKEGKALTRSGAQSGDRIYVTGTIGDAALGHKILSGEYPETLDSDKIFLCSRFRIPTPRHVLAQHLADTVHSATDISHGLLKDLNLICVASDLQAFVRLDKIPTSRAVKNLLEATDLKQTKEIHDLICFGGNDYELLFTASAGESDHIDYLSRRYSVPITCIGHLGMRPEVSESDTVHRIKLLDENGQEIKVESP